MEQLNGCEYYFGPLAIELLVADYGGLPNLLRLWETSNLRLDFEDAFESVYGMTLSYFETVADSYISAIAQVERMR
jgi:hypothetical protein